MALEKLKSLLPANRILSTAAELATYGKDWISDYTPSPSCVALPENEAEVQALLKCCNENNIAVVPSGGRTGLSGGATAIGGEVVVSLERLNSFIQVNPLERTITVDAGVLTEKVQQIAFENQLYFPIDFASKGSSQIGGNIATNVGGIRVIRYGNMREQVLSLNVVLADGTPLTLNGELLKNNSGYDFRSLFIGSEGTLGIITRATLKLTRPPGDLVRILCGLTSLPAILTILERCRARFPAISAFEYFPRNGLEKVLAHHRIRDPFDEAFPFYLLIEIEEIAESLREEVEEFFCEMLEDETLAWVVMSQSTKQLDELLSLRELLPETLSSLHTLHKNDISVPISQIPSFLSRFESLLLAEYPDFEIVTFGHIGDGNLHVNVIKPEALSDSDFFAHAKAADAHLFALIQEFKGSISAEHGVGLKKKEFLSYSRTASEIKLMQGIKRVFDPKGILNPGKIFDL